MTAPHETQRRGRSWTVWACVEPDCDYVRLEKSTGVHPATNRANPRGPLLTHHLAPVEVAPVQPEGERRGDEDVKLVLETATAGDEYADGVKDALAWVLGQTDTPPPAHVAPESSPPTTQEARTDG